MRRKRDILRRSLAALAMIALGLSSCGQDQIDWPSGDGGTCGAECGSWYPRPDATGKGKAYRIEKDYVAACLVWQKALRGDDQTYLSLGELYLKATREKNAAKTLLIFVSARNCPQCKTLAEAINARKDEFDAAGAVMVAGAASDIQDPSVHLTLDEADRLLIEEGWPKDWYRINDEEKFLEKFYNPAPWIIVIDLSRMKVLEASWDRFTADNVDDLLNFLETGR